MGWFANRPWQQSAPKGATNKITDFERQGPDPLRPYDI